MKFDVLSVYEAEEIEIEEPHIWISIRDPDVEPARIKKSESCKGILRLYFYDVEKDYGEIYPNLDLFDNFDFTIIFTKEWAEDIRAFVEKYKDDIETIYIHCEAGISRSSAVAAALGMWLNGEDEYSEMPGFKPNKLVREILMEVCGVE